MSTDPRPVRIVVRGLLWAPLLGGVVGSAVWIGICLATLSIPAVVLTPIAFGVGAAAGLVPGLIGATAVAAVARRGPLTPGTGAVVSAVAGAGIAFDLTLVGLRANVGAVLGFWVVASILLAGAGAVGGLLVARPVRDGSATARRSDAAAAAGTACPGWSPAHGR